MVKLLHNGEAVKEVSVLLSPPVILGIALLQFIVLVRSPLRYIPSRAVRAEAHQVLDTLAHVPGDIYVFNNAADLSVVGKKSFANTDAVFDVLRADEGPIGTDLKYDVETSFRRQEYAAVVSDKPLNQSDLPVGASPDLESFYAFSMSPVTSGSESLSNAFTQDAMHLSPRYLSFARNAELPHPSPR